MAVRRDELSAYAFAKRRMVAAFLQAPAGGDEEAAPRPFRAVVPGLVTSALLVAGFGGWGMFRPTAPKGWDEPGARILVGKESTTRYVVLRTAGRPHLHPVLNMASARLLVGGADAGPDLLQVPDAVLDAGRPPRGPVLGIPYAPDRLPTPDEAGTPKHWAVCQAPEAAAPGHPDPGTGDAAPTPPTPAGSVPADPLRTRTAAFVLAPREAGLLENRHRLKDAEVLYVQGPDGVRHLIDKTGTSYPLGGPAREHGLLLTALLGASPSLHPQRVSAAWLATLRPGDPVAFPALPGTPGARAGVGGLGPAEDRVGMVLRTVTGAGVQHYVVIPGAVRPVSDFEAGLLVHAPAADRLELHGRPRDVDLQSVTPTAPPEADRRWPGRPRWPEHRPVLVNPTGEDGPTSEDAATGDDGATGEDGATGPGSRTGPGGDPGARTTLCVVRQPPHAPPAEPISVPAAGRPTDPVLYTWAAPTFPADATATGNRTYVTPGSGLLFTQVQGSGPDANPTEAEDGTTPDGHPDAPTPEGTVPHGSLFLLTDTGLRHALRSGGAGRTGPGNGYGEARIRLGYGRIPPVSVPRAWSEFLALGPRLDTEAARRPQGS
ncbi:type VII secretion protein EccB [Streptomyces sp. NPDC097619]|uniref:type VII secretion protein EccB n=1 Tax=Streptomyces sp. NPDC097619 TaxID=3157228 RepID=UPI003321690F